MRWWRKLGITKADDDPATNNAALLKAIEALAKSDTSSSRAKLYNILLQSWLIIPTPELPAGVKPGLGTTTEDTQIQITGFTDNQNLRVTAAFTDDEALRNWDPNTPSISLSARVFFQMIRDLDIAAVVINPYDPVRKMVRPGGRLTRFEFLTLADGLIPGQGKDSGVTPITFPKGQTVFIGLPAKPPADQVLQAVAERGRTIAEVKQLYLFQMSVGGGDPHVAIGVELSVEFGVELNREAGKERVQEIMRSLSLSVNPILKQGDSMDFLIIQGSLGESIRQHGRKLLSPQI